MGTQKHSPAPWAVVEGMSDGVYEIEMAGEVIKEIGFEVRPGTVCERVEKKADAKLIAASPDLLAACIRAERVLTQLSAMMLNPKMRDYIPYGLDGEAVAADADCHAAIQKAQSR